MWKYFKEKTAVARSQDRPDNTAQALHDRIQLLSRIAQAQQGVGEAVSPATQGKEKKDKKDKKKK